MKRIVCLISGRGSNLESILNTAESERWATEVPARVVAVISNRADAAGLAVAAAHGVPTSVIEQQRFASREAFDARLADAIEAHQPDVVVLAGFMRVLGSGFVARFAGRLINIHPSLLPAFPGLATHRQALAAGVRVHGATVHFVASEVDGGAIIAQAAIAVLADDGEESLAARVLSREHLLLPRCVRWLCEGRVALRDGRTVVGDLPSGALALLV
ncbi:MAG: phosphoribosylglycinamide formyltransferase [Burkholderiales bacterium]|jgi:phosphoribosylglycinamide formyltransferase-1|nr:phosphoribosylglycinamide formyltransferase [Burkholderiales bacterium]